MFDILINKMDPFNILRVLIFATITVTTTPVRVTIWPFGLKKDLFITVLKKHLMELGME